MDLFPTGMIDNIIINKALTPDLPADWAGAFLSIETKEYPTNLSVQVSTSFWLQSSILIPEYPYF